jgi:D-tyrosyl-tRNA(Tyr) deacylase
MLALLQRVNFAKVAVDNQTVGSIDQGLLVFLAIEPNDTEESVERLLHRVLGYRIFADDKGRMNLSVKDINGGLLLVPQFTLAANTKKGMRPSFSRAAPPELGERLFNYLVELAKNQYDKIACGKFGAYMQVTLCNDGPVTFVLQ